MPCDKNVLIKEEKKIAKCVPLAKDLTKVQKISTKIVPVVIRGLGLVSPKFVKTLEGIGYTRYYR